MLLTSVIVTVREVLEAAMIVSVLLAMAHTLALRQNWLGWALGTGMTGAFIFAANTGSLSEAFDGVGQEICNATLQFLIYICLAVCVVLFNLRETARQSDTSLFRLLMFISVALALTREGSEIILYLSAFRTGLAQSLPVLIGAFIGGAIGLSAGVLVYVMLVDISRRWTPAASSVLLSLVAAGMAGQAAVQLVQADWLPAGAPVWDTSRWLPEDSVAGQLLYALIGYESTPSAVQAAIYFGGLILPLAAVVVLRWSDQADHRTGP